ncbi:hypothetical protein [uncultured Prevotella sp.]|uniref:hypothetical protein n=1 Tax=uncultured Prevotella sp. TaxID=159272 RepID=UPI00265CF6A4|nr:hypothetical protein [uncultured Prevotella sp.]
MKRLKKIHSFLTDKEKVKNELYWIKKVWYILLLTLSTVYVDHNFDMIVTQSFTCQFNGNSLIFILWIVLLFFPLFNSIEGYGFKLSKEREKQEEQTLKIKFLRDKILKDNSELEVDELEKQYETIIREKKDE